jgi:sarcosine oxidase, subunit gamma
MVEAYWRRSPLAGFGLPARVAAQGPAAAAEAELLLGENPHRCQLNLRGDPGDPGFLDAVRQATGLELPVEPNTVARAGDLRALWLGPDEWLVAGPAGRETEVAPKLALALAGRHAGVTDVSEARTAIRVAGPKARVLLAKGCPLDFHPREFGVGRCAQSGLAGANVLIELLDDRPTFEVGVLDSFADHLWRWLERASADWRVAILD